MPNEMKYDRVFEGLEETKKTEVFSRILDMDSRGISLGKMEGIIRDIIEGDLPSEINDNGEGAKQMKHIEEFMMKSEENKNFVEELIFLGHSSEEIVEIIKIDDTTEKNN